MKFSLPSFPARVAVAALALIVAGRRADAGGGVYDPKTRSFSLNYIYLDLPSGVLDENQVQLGGSSTRPDAGQQADIQRFWRLVSDKLATVTAGRARIGQLTEVHDIEKADAVISLTGTVRPAAGGAWASMLGWRQGGTLNLYYQDLVDAPSEIVVETVVHELCHYFFGLPDEYAPAPASHRLCPLNAPGDKRCLMDNYNFGWIGRLCARDDHNPRAPGSNGYAVVNDPALSCQEIVDAFFQQWNVAADAGGVPEPVEPVRVKPSPSGWPRITPVLAPFEKLLILKAVEFAKQVVDPAGRADAIELKLLAFLRDQLRSSTGAVVAPTAIGLDELNYIGDLAIRAAAGDLPPAATLDPARDELQIEIARTVLAIADDLHVPGAGDRGANLRRLVPGLGERSKIPDRTLGRRFGRRRTVLVEPPILAGPTLDADGIDLVDTQGDPKVNYNDLRRELSRQFSRLIDRDRITAYSAVSAAGVAGAKDLRVGIAELDSPEARDVFDLDKREAARAIPSGTAKVDPGLADLVFSIRRERLGSAFALIRDAIESDQVENIVVLVPPGGIPDEFAEPIAALGEQFAGKADLRIDVALVGSAAIPPELRDLVARTQGSILTVTDIDEVGSVAQRLAGEQTQGTWVTIPQQDLLLVDVDRSDFADEPRERPSSIYNRLRAVRVPHEVSSTLGKSSNVALRPFHFDDATEHELIVGLTQPLTVAGLFPSPDDGKDAPWLARSPEDPTLFAEPELRLLPRAIGDPAEVGAIEDGRRPRAFAQARRLRLDRARSTKKVLVYRLPPVAKGGPVRGWYTPVLTFQGSNFRDVPDPARPVPADAPAEVRFKAHPYRNHAIHFTFSVGTPTSKAQLVANLIQEIPPGAPIARRGTIALDQPRAVVTAVLTAGAAVVGAEVVGHVQRVDEGARPIDTLGPIAFLDDGQGPDKVEGDGIYTASIGLEPRRSARAEYRLLIEGHSVAGRTKFVPAGERLAGPGVGAGVGADPNPAGAAADAGAVRGRPVPVFQRATSLHFSAPADR